MGFPQKRGSRSSRLASSQPPIGNTTVKAVSETCWATGAPRASMTTMTGPSPLHSSKTTAFLSSPTAKNSEAWPQGKEVVHAGADGGPANDLRSQYQSMEGTPESLALDAQTTASREVGEIATPPHRGAVPVAVRGIGGGAALPGWSRVERAPQGPSFGDYLDNDQRWQGLLDGEGGVLLAPTCSYSRDKRTSALGLHVRARALVSSSSSSLSSLSSSSRSLFGGESGAVMQEGQGGGQAEGQGLETPYVALSAEGLAPPMSHAGGQGGPGGPLTTTHSAQGQGVHATSSSALCPNGTTRRRRGVLWSLARKVSSALTLFPDRNDNLQKLPPSSASRRPLPPEVEGYTRMYEPPLHTPSPPRPFPSPSPSLQGGGNACPNTAGSEGGGKIVGGNACPNTTGSEGESKGGGGLQASGCVSPLPVPQQEHVFRASEMWTLRTVLARLQATHRHCQATGTDTPPGVLGELVAVEGRLQALAQQEAQRWEDLAAQQLHALQQQQLFERTADFQREGAANEQQQQLFERAGATDEAQRPQLAEGEELKPDSSPLEGGEEQVKVGGRGSWQAAQQGDVSPAGVVGGSQGGGARFRTFSHQSGRLETTQAASSEEWRPLPDA